MVQVVNYYCEWSLWRLKQDFPAKKSPNECAWKLGDEVQQSPCYCKIILFFYEMSDDNGRIEDSPCHSSCPAEGYKHSEDGQESVP